jgi:hypothetical protein
MAKMALIDNGFVINLVEVGPETDPSMFNGTLVDVDDSVLIGFSYDVSTGEFAEPEQFPELSPEEVAELVASVPVAPAPTEE